MTRYYKVIETGKIYTLEEIQELEDKTGKKTKWSELCQVWPRVKNADRSKPEDWTDHWGRAIEWREY